MIKLWIICGVIAALLNLYLTVSKEGSDTNSDIDATFLKNTLMQIIGGLASLIYVSFKFKPELQKLWCKFGDFFKLK